ncbi:SDR family NAD(P)-dependent oxidoreductase [Novosphingobium taihuense]|uniref:3alpha(Or 20beta)-hydroxysteroid dehydrogenase n=1 Tax=Novosphingobium taihuense TaxID=260085 RepID=A0A7W7ABI5_9SPHN|nr:glucose 1-dehydrogenase [Novosphingobium taihuense]MBB4613963.1 3alpha(or 20beta)-hydroxysteroid dehydrogenase [Novosphingobium taihuense]TWH86814.1 3alpha(or 20beta)-hydroxysteroid dehydrogenase [Novosphingobium taihuense]
MGKLEGKVAIVTGGGRGMGAATVRRFVADGAKVAIADVLEAEGSALAAELGDAARFYRLDVTNEENWAKVVSAVEADLGPVSVLVNNAGILMFKSLLETTKADYERVLGVNLVGEFLGIKAVAPGMIARGKGSIVNISSVDGMKGANSLVAYASSKWGVRGLTKVAAMELGHKGVRVNSVHPGGVDTVMSNHNAAPRAEVDKGYANVPLQRIGGPEEVAAASAFLASDDASYMHGAELVVDGGMTVGTYYMGFPGSPGM